MPRRLHIADLHPGVLSLDAAQARHARQVLRLVDGDEVELFDDAGRTAVATIVGGLSHEMNLRVDAVKDARARSFRWTVAAAVPKGERADWMVEKLSELGCETFIPLIAERSVVVPKGTGKSDRWTRIATESAKQCRRPGVMRIEKPAVLDDLLRSIGIGPGVAGWFFDTGPTAIAARELLVNPQPPRTLTVLVGPEGGWSPAEVDRMLDARLTAVGLTPTILRVETAAVTAGALVAAMWATRPA
jgi:16S rRNA (uracil1498-N3)-methyltransferase